MAAGRQANLTGVQVFDYGLGNGYRNMTASLEGKSTSGMDTEAVCQGNCATLYIKDIVDTVHKLHRMHKGYGDNILYTNCEGCEIEVLERLLDTEMIKYFKYIHFATHALGKPGQAHSLCKIRWHLMSTHAMQYGFFFAQERWVRVIDTVYADLV